MHILEALMKDHRKVIDLVDELISLDDNDVESRNDLVGNIRDELVPHSRAEESIFYNSLRAIDADSHKIMHGFKEHLEAETLLRTLQVEEGIHLPWKATAKKLRDALAHHIKQEETEIFALARKVLTKKEGEKLGLLFEQIKPQIQEEGFMKTSLDLIVNVLPPRFSSGVKNFLSGESHLL